MDFDFDFDLDFGVGVEFDFDSDCEFGVTGWGSKMMIFMKISMIDVRLRRVFVGRI